MSLYFDQSHNPKNTITYSLTKKNAQHSNIHAFHKFIIPPGFAFSCPSNHSLNSTIFCLALLCRFLCARFPLQKAALLNRAPTMAHHSSVDYASISLSLCDGRGGRRRMWDVLGHGVFAADGGHAGIRGFAGFGEGVVA
jgi:hypothetical protein